jgi:hypothetical protein
MIIILSVALSVLYAYEQGLRNYSKSFSPKETSIRRPKVFKHLTSQILKGSDDGV